MTDTRVGGCTPESDRRSVCLEDAHPRCDFPSKLEANASSGSFANHVCIDGTCQCRHSCYSAEQDCMSGCEA